MCKSLIVNERIVKTLQAAKKYLSHTPIRGSEIKETNHICHAVDRALIAREITFIEMRTVKSLIKGRLGGTAFTLVHWLNNQNIYGTHEQYQQHRHAWIDKLIEEFSNGNQNTKAT